MPARFLDLAGILFPSFWRQVVLFHPEDPVYFFRQPHVSLALLYLTSTEATDVPASRLPHDSLYPPYLVVGSLIHGVLTDPWALGLWSPGKAMSPGLAR